MTKKDLKWPKSWRFITKKVKCDGRTDGRTDRRTDGWTDKASYRVACPQLKRWWREYFISIIGGFPLLLGRRAFFGVTSNAVTRKDAGASRKVSEWGEEEIVGRKGARRRWRRARRMRQRCRERRTKKNKPGYTATKVACGWAGAVIG